MSNSFETKSKALVYEFKDDPAAIAPSNVQPKDTVRVGVADSTFGMTRLDDTLCNGEAVFLRFDYTDHLHITHQCGAEMRLNMWKKARANRIEPEGQWLELRCRQCHSEYMPYRQVGDIDLSEPSDQERRINENKTTPIRLRNDVCGFNGMFRLAGYDRVINAAQHPVSTVEDDRFDGIRSGKGIVNIQVDRHRHIAFVHRPCGRRMGVKITHVTDPYNKDFIWVTCRCKYLRRYSWLRKVVTIVPGDQHQEILRNKPAKEPTTPIDWMDAVIEHEWDPESKTPIPTSLMIGWVILALRDLRHNFPKEKSYDGRMVTWYRPSEPWRPWVQCSINDYQFKIAINVNDILETTCFDFKHRNDAVAFIRQVLASSQV